MMKKKKKSLPTIWEVPDELWKRMAPLILEMDPPKDTGRPRANPRSLMDAIIFRIRTGCREIIFRGSTGITRPFIAPFNTG